MRVYSNHSLHAMKLLGKMIRQARIDRRMPAEDLAERASISRTTLAKIERGDMKVEVGLVFEVAHIVGVQLFGQDAHSLRMFVKEVDDRLTLIPKYARKTKRVLHDDF